MSRRGILHGVAAAALLAGGACYQDDTTTSVFPSRGKPLAKVLLTDAPFPYDSVASVNIYVVRIEASANFDTSGSAHWEVITEPRKSFNLLELQRGTTAFVGEGELPAGLYHAVRMTMDTSRSSIFWNDGSRAPVNWQNWFGSNEEPLYALLQYPVNVPTEGAEIVLDFDVGRSFLYAFYGTQEFTFMPQFRAVNSAATGTIAGTVASDYTGKSAHVPKANVSVYVGDPNQPSSTWSLVATARSDSAAADSIARGYFPGYYRVAFLPAGTYIVRAEDPDNPLVGPAIAWNVPVVAGKVTFSGGLFLPRANPGGGAYVRIWPRDNRHVGVCGQLSLRAAVIDANGEPVQNPSVAWMSSDTAIATVTEASDRAVADGWVTGRRAGFATVTATSGGLSDTLTIQVFGSDDSVGSCSPAGPVARVIVSPDSASLAVGDTLSFSASPLDSAGNFVYNRPVSWFTTDSSVLVIEGVFGSGAIIRARGAGTAHLRATSDGKTGQATITVR
jgi:hypothetical protein